MQVNRTGIFFVNDMSRIELREFPREFRRSLFGEMEKSYVLLLATCTIVLGGLTFLLSLRELPQHASDSEIQRIQERYAQLVLNQPRPKEEPRVEKVVTETVSKKETAEQEETEVDRKKETFVERRQRKEATSEDRRRKRDEIKQEIQSAGIFAAITSTGRGGPGGTSAVADLLGAAKEVGGLNDIDISQGTFATRSIEQKTLDEKRGGRTGEIEIERKAVGKTEVQQMASAGSVNVTSQPPEMNKSVGSSSQSCINRIVQRQNVRLTRVYENRLKQNPELSGRLRIKFTILPSGAVAQAEIVSSTIKDSQFEQTILRYIRQWTFPGCGVTEPLQIEVPFVFEGAS